MQFADEDKAWLSGLITTINRQSEERTATAIRESEQRTTAAIRDVEQRTAAAIEASETRLLTHSTNGPVRWMPECAPTPPPFEHSTSKTRPSAIA